MSSESVQASGPCSPARTRRFWGVWTWLERVGGFVGWLAFSVLRVRREHVLRSLRTARLEPAEQTARAMYRSLGVSLCEFLGMAVLPPETLFARIELDDSRLLAEARGSIAATAHTANWDLVACAIARRLPLMVVTKRLSLGWLDRLWQTERSKTGLRLTTVGQAVGAGREILRAGGVLAMLVDQAPERARAVIPCAFLGQTAYVDLAPALLAQRFRCPLLAVFPLRRVDGTYALEPAGVLHPPARPSRSWAESAMRQVTVWLEQFVRAHPEQWLWLHRRWKGARVG
ncbi:MAG: lysophospholipid acyltransferase family protein [Polyangiaceae bacterium]|nr:lysophospholipid acyltransferase family protein [Polyangiaceae bacterium]